MSFSEDLEALSGKAEALKARWPVYTEMVDWLVELLAETMRAESRVRLSELLFHINGVHRDPGEGKALFQPEFMPADVSLTRELYMTLAAKTEQCRGEAASGLRYVLSGPESETLEWIRAVLKPDSQRLESLWEEYGVDPEGFGLLLKLAMRPSLRMLSRKASAELDFSHWSFGHCPVCASLPALAALGGQGEKRILYCSLCETSWMFPRLRCPFCENENQGDLSYLYAEGERGLRIDLCQRCGLHLKTVDLQHFPGPVIPVLDTLVTSHLEVAAKANRNIHAV